MPGSKHNIPIHRPDGIGPDRLREVVRLHARGELVQLVRERFEQRLRVRGRQV